MALILGACLILTGCTAPRVSSKKEPVKISLSKDPVTLDPRKAHDLASSSLCFMLYEGLFRTSEKGHIEFGICQDIYVSSDKKTYRLKLKKTYWSDGSELTAFDFRDSWLSQLDPDFPSPFAYLFYPIHNAKKYKQKQCSLDQVGINAIDKQTLEIKLEYPKSDLSGLLSFSPFFPYKTSQNRVLFNGPYKLIHLKHHSEILLEKNSYYHEVSSVQCPGLLIRIIDSETTALQLFYKGELDILGGPLSGIPCEELKIKKPDYLQPMAGSTLCVFNTQSPLFQNVNLRKAFALAIDHDALSKLFPFPIKQIKSFLPEYFSSNIGSLFESKPSSEANIYLEKALKELNLDKKELNHLCYYIGGKTEHAKIAQVLHACWKKNLKVDVNLVKLEHKMLSSKIADKQFDMAQSLWLAPYDNPLALLDRFNDKTCAKNFSSFASKDLSLLINQLETSSSTPTIIPHIEKILQEQIPFVPLTNWQYAYYVSPKIASLNFTPLGTLNYTFIKISQDSCSSSPR